MCDPYALANYFQKQADNTRNLDRVRELNLGSPATLVGGASEYGRR